MRMPDVCDVTARGFHFQNNMATAVIFMNLRKHSLNFEFHYHLAASDEHESQLHDI